MLHISTSVFSLIEKISAADTVSAAWDVFRNAASDAGLPYGLAYFVPGDGLSARLVVADLPADWVRSYDSQELHRVDPLAVRIRKATQPFLFDLDEWKDDPLPGRRAWYELDQDAGLNIGLAIPDQTRGTSKAICLAGGRAALDSRDLLTLQFAGWAMLQRMHELGVRYVSLENLSEREIECLKWAADGKSDWEIGCILSLSEKTVNTYVERAKSKLQVSTRAQAIVTAFRRGLLDF